MSSFDFTTIVLACLLMVCLFIGADCAKYGDCIEAGMQWIDGDCIK